GCVCRDIHELRIVGRNGDDLLAFLRLRLDLELLRALEITYVLRLGAQPLDGVENGALVRGKGLTQLRGPLHLHAHHVDGFRELEQGACGRTETELDRKSVV